MPELGWGGPRFPPVELPFSGLRCTLHNLISTTVLKRLQRAGEPRAGPLWMLCSPQTMNLGSPSFTSPKPKVDPREAETFLFPLPSHRSHSPGAPNTYLSSGRSPRHLGQTPPALQPQAGASPKLQCSLDLLPAADPDLT